MSELLTKISMQTWAELFGLSVSMFQWLVLAFFGVLFLVFARKFFLHMRAVKSYRAVEGDILSFFSKRVRKRRNRYRTYYDFVIEAEGKRYHLQSINRKAKKYQNAQQTVILIPEYETDEDEVILEIDRPKLWVFLVLLGIGILLLGIALIGIPMNIINNLS